MKIQNLLFRSLSSSSNLLTFRPLLNYKLPQHHFCTQCESQLEQDDEDFETKNDAEISEDEEFYKTLDYDIRDDPFWNDLDENRKSKMLYCQRHKDPRMWKDGVVPHAVSTSNFDYNTIKAVQRFPSLGHLAQKETKARPYIKSLDENVINRIDYIKNHNGLHYKQPKPRQMLHLLHHREVKEKKKDTVDYRIKAGDVIELVLYTNLQKGTTQRSEGLVMATRRKRTFNGSFVLRNVEKDGLVVFRHFPLYSPWIKSIKVLSSYKVKRKQLYYMQNAPADVEDPVKYGDEIGVRSRKEFFAWLKNTKEGLEYLRDVRLKKRINFLGMRIRNRWAKRIADLHAGTAATKDVKGPYRLARREAFIRRVRTPHHIDDARINKKKRGYF